MASIQAVFIRGHEERPEPKPHVVYRIEIQAYVRTWQMWRRYSEFTELHTELVQATGQEPPAPLPSKHVFSLRGTIHNATVLEERSTGLERYLRAIISSKDDRWRESFAFKDFLGIPVGRLAGVDGGPPAEFTASSWLDEHADLQAQIRSIRADLNRKEAMSAQGDVSESHKANVQAQKKLVSTLTRAGSLAEGLTTLGLRGMSEGELQRRTDMVGRLKDDCNKLGQMVAAGRKAGPTGEAPEAMADRKSLLGGGASGTFVRAFGAAAKAHETEATRPLDDKGLLQLQQEQMDQQDATLSQFTSILQRQKHLGVAINQEIREQIEMLDSLSDDVDKVGGKLGAAKKQLNRLG